MRTLHKGTVIHAVLTWTSTESLSLTACMVIAEPHEAFRQFFIRETDLHKASLEHGPSFRPEKDATPLRILSAATAANATSPPEWKVRKLAQAP